MATTVQFELNRQGIRALLGSSGVQAMLEGKAEAVASAARSRGVAVDGYPGDVALPVAVVPAGNGNRARALVVVDHPSAMAVEAKHRVLGSALDAARGA